MAVNINTVYQKVLAIANKEKRGYITPQEFNLFADQAQKEIFEQYFYDLNQFKRVSGNTSEYSDMVDYLEDKIKASKCHKSQIQKYSNVGFNIEENLKKLVIELKLEDQVKFLKDIPSDFKNALISKFLEFFFVCLMITIHEMLQQLLHF